MLNSSHIASHDTLSLVNFSSYKPQRRSKKHADKPVPPGIKLRKASNWREPSKLAAKPGYSPFVDFAMRELIPPLPVTGKKKSLEKQCKLLCGLLYQLMETGLRGRLVRDTRNTHFRGVELRVKLWDLLIAHGWCDIYLGTRIGSLWTRYEAMPRLLQCLPDCHEVIRSNPLVRNTDSPDHPVRHAVVYGHSGKHDLQTGKKLPKTEWKQPLPFPDQDDLLFGILRTYEDFVVAINHHNATHDWRIELSPGVSVVPDIELRQVHVGKWNRFMRLFTSGILGAQSLRELIRQTMTIDGEATVELDFSSMVPRMVYHSLKLEAAGDVYRTDQVFPWLKQFAAGDKAFRSLVRKVLKRAMNIMFNVDRRETANKTIASYGRKFLNDAKFRGFFIGIEGLDFPSLVERIEQVHPDINGQFYRCIGMEMMTKEALIMLLSLSDITETGRPALGIHDAIRCRESDADFVESIMRKNYSSQFPGFTPEISRSTD